jgi:hypothetical protein
MTQMAVPMPIAMSLVALDSLRDAARHVERRRAVFTQSQLLGHISMLTGGGKAALGLLIEVENGWLVRVDLGSAARLHLAAALLSHTGDD